MESRKDTITKEIFPEYDKPGKESSLPARPITSLDAERIGPSYQRMKDSKIIEEINRQNAVKAQREAQSRARYLIDKSGKSPLF